MATSLRWPKGQPQYREHKERNLDFFSPPSYENPIVKYLCFPTPFAHNDLGVSQNVSNAMGSSKCWGLIQDFDSVSSSGGSSSGQQQPPPQLPRFDEARCSTDGCQQYAKWSLHKEVEEHDAPRGWGASGADGFSAPQIFCGNHCNMNQEGRQELDKSRYEEFKTKVRAERAAAVDSATAANKSAGKLGTVTVIGDRLNCVAHCNRNSGKGNLVGWGPFGFSFQGDFYRDGALAVFPNAMHGDTAEGFGCATLSPKTIGPVHHCDPNLPAAKNLENDYQFSKVFHCNDRDSIGVYPSWYQQRSSGYASPNPHRHSPSSDNGKNTMLYSLFSNSSGQPRQYTHIESRLFYCYYTTSERSSRCQSSSGCRS
jgi:hypothetical protein